MTRLGAIAHIRTGDKGDTSQIAVVAYRLEDYPLLAQQLTAGRVQQHMSMLSVRQIHRHELPELGALNFVLEGALRGGVTRSTALDAHGKTLGMQLLDIDLDQTSPPPAAGNTGKATFSTLSKQGTETK